MTALTTMSAAMNMLHGDKSRGDARRLRHAAWAGQLEAGRLKAARRTAHP